MTVDNLISYINSVVSIFFTTPDEEPGSSLSPVSFLKFGLRSCDRFGTVATPIT